MMKLGECVPPRKEWYCATLKWWNWKNGSTAVIWNSSIYLCFDSMSFSSFWRAPCFVAPKKHMIFVTKIFNLIHSKLTLFHVSKLDPEWVVYTYQKGHTWAKMKLLVKSSKCYTNLLTTSGDSIRVHHRYNYHKGRVPGGCPFNCSYYFVSQNLARGAHGSKENDMTWRLASNGGTLTKTNRYCSWKVRGLEAKTSLSLLLGGLLVQPGKCELP